MDRGTFFRHARHDSDGPLESVRVFTSGDPDSPDNPLGRATYVFDTLATAKAQTVLRYWNWSFTADAANIEHVAFDDETLELSLARRNAALLFNRNG